LRTPNKSLGSDGLKAVAKFSQRSELLAAEIGRSAQDGLEKDMETYAFKIQISPSLYHLLELEGSTYAKKQEAINVLTEAFNKNRLLLERQGLGKAFTIKEEENRTVFVNEKGGELAVIVPC